MAQNEKQNEKESLEILQLLHIQTNVLWIFSINSKNYFSLKKIYHAMLTVSAYLQIIPPKQGMMEKFWYIKKTMYNFALIVNAIFNNFTVFYQQNMPL